MIDLNERRDDEHRGSKLERKRQDETKAKGEEWRGSEYNALNKNDCE